MGRTFLDQDTQIYSSFTYSDTLTVGSTLQTGAANLEDDLNALRTQVKQILLASDSGNWYDALAFPVGSSARGIKQLATDLYDIEQHKFLFRGQVLTDIAVPASQNWVVLSAAGSETPTETAAVDGSTANGTVVATLSLGAIGSNQLTVVSGVNAINPKNLVLVIDGVTGQPIQATSGAGAGKDIYGLLQAENGVVDGNAFDDTSHRVQISFVTENATASALIAAPVADIAGKTINYAYVRRLNLDSLPEQAFLTGVFLDQTVAATDVTLDKAIDNQVGAVTQTDRNIDWRVTNGFTFKFQNSAGSQDFVSLAPTVGGTTLSYNVTDETHTTANPATFTKGVSVATGSTQLNVGTTAGQVDSAGALTLASASTFNTSLNSGNKLTFSDTYQGASTYSGTLALADATSEWSNYVSAFGQVSLLNAIYQARNSGGSIRTKGVAVVTTAAAADTNMTGAGGTPNLDAQLPAYSSGNFVSSVDVYVNGQLLRNGANVGAGHDVYPGTTPANGDLKFTFSLKAGSRPDVITSIVYN